MYRFYNELVRKPAKKKLTAKKKIAVGLVTITAVGVIGLGLGNKIKIPLYSMERVVDGDTFVTTDNQMIRILGIDAPEIGRCGADEATESLTKILKRSPLYIKIVFRDSSNRLYGLVYNIDGSVAKQQLERGMAVSTGSNVHTADADLTESVEIARDKKRGIYGPKCTQLTNMANPKCVIKGNNRRSTDSKPTYHFPGCGEYNSTIVQLYAGDQWFCTEKEAIKAGYEKGADCFGKTYN